MEIENISMEYAISTNDVLLKRRFRQYTLKGMDSQSGITETNSGPALHLQF